MSLLSSAERLVFRGIAVSLLFPALSSAQGLAREALSSFPADTEQLAYANLADLRRLPNYAEIRRRIVTRPLLGLEDFLRLVGTDPERDLDEIVLGWRGPKFESGGFFGLAEGRFKPGTARAFFDRHSLPVREYEGETLYAFGSGDAPSDLFFTFPSASSAAFGRLSDLKAMLDVRARPHPALDSNTFLVDQEAELEGTAPYWGIATGKAVTRGVPWLALGQNQPAGLSALLGPVEAVLYRVDFSEGLLTRLSIICKSADSADALAKVLMLWHGGSRVSGRGGPGTIASLSELDVEAHGSRVELSASGPLELIDSLNR